MKNCTKCGETKPVSDFYQRANGKVESRCKGCFKAISRKSATTKEKTNMLVGDGLRISDKLKTCARCNQDKPYAEFNRQRKNADGHASVCQECARPYARKYYETNRERIREHGTASWQKALESKREFYIDYLKTHPCVDCGITNVLVLQADHQGNKQGIISHMISNACSLEKLKQELAKCEIRCANCHQIRTAHQFGFWRLNYV